MVKKQKPILVANWKMNGSLDRVEAFCRSIAVSSYCEKVDCIFCPPAIYLSTAQETLLSSEVNGNVVKMPVSLGAQDTHPLMQGAYTGEISASMLTDFSVSHVLVGHSERRSLFGESVQYVSEKFNAAIEQGLVPILCVGETLEEREEERSLEVIRAQMKLICGKMAGNVKQWMIAYEPVWAIGSGRCADQHVVQSMHEGIHGILESEGLSPVPLLYGGSVSESTVRELTKLDEVDGFLVGGASLQSDSFLSIAKQLL